MSLKQQRCSPLPCSPSILLSSSSSSSSAIKPANKKLRFRRRQSGSHSSNGSLTGDLSSSQLSVGDCSTHSAAHGGNKSKIKSKKRSSLLPRWMKKGRSSSSSKTDLVVMDKFSMQYGEQQEETRNDCHCLCNGNNSSPSAAVTRALEEAAALNELGQQLQRADQIPEALGKWKEGLNLLQSRLNNNNNNAETSTKEVARVSNDIVCQMIAAHLYLGENCSAGESQRQHMTEVASLVQQLKLPLNDDTVVMECAKHFWGESHFQFSASSTTPLLDLLMRQSCWSLALHIASKALGSTPADQLILARLHLEVAMQYQDQDNCKSCNGNNGKESREPRDAESSRTVTTSHQARSQQISHLGECHQLLLSLEPSKNSHADHDSYQALWQDLAQAYGMMGEEELALGCSQSRIQRLTATTTTTLSSDSRAKDVALCHYEQALDVYTPVGQYGLALKEAELALEALRLLHPSSQSSLSATKEGKEEEDAEVELLLMKLYQFKADVLCRMGRITESMDSYEILLQLHLQSSRHGPIEAANVLYILGKLCVRAKQYQKALDYFDQELKMTQSVVGPNHLAISKILHELARVADLGMMDYPRAVQYYQKALEVESWVYQQCMNLKKWQEEHKQPSSSADVMLLQDAKHQIGETKQCIGKLFFKLGDLDKAVGVAVGK